MPVPSVFKSAPFLYGTTGTVGAAGVVATGWQFLGSGQGIPDASALGLNAGSIKAEIDGSYGCFSSFFEGVGFPSSSGGGTLDSINPFTNVTPTTPKGGENPAGCMIMQLSYDLNNSQNPKWVFKGEITIKSGNIGWALWLSGYGGKYAQYNTQYGQQMNHKLVFLEKNSSDAWEIKTGLGWSDWITTNSFSVRVAEPNGKVWIDKYVEKNMNEDFVGLTADPKAHVYSYSGEWKEVQEDGKEVFEDVDILEKKEYEKILLKRKGGFGQNIPVSCIYDGGSWKAVTQSAPTIKAQQNDLNKWYETFNGKKGKWSKFK